MKTPIRRAIGALVRVSLPYEGVRRDARCARSALIWAVSGCVSETFARHRVVLAGGDVRVNIGCGGLRQDGWLNMDLKPSAGVLYMDAINGIRVPDACGGRTGLLGISIC